MRRIVVVALVSLLVAGCGSATPSAAPTAPVTAPPTAAPTPTAVPTPTAAPTEDPLIGVIRDAATATVATDTVTIEFEAKFNGNVTLEEGTSFGGIGATAFSKPTRMVLQADFSALGIGQITVIVDDTLLYMSGEFLEALDFEDGQWLLVDLESDDPRAVPFLSVTQGQNDNSLVMYYLLGAMGPVKQLADVDINGARTSHYSMPIDLDRAIELVPPVAREYLLDNIAGLRTAGIERDVAGEAWVDDDGLVRQVRFVYTLGRVAGGGTMEVMYEFDDFGEPIDLGIPDEDDVVRLEDVPA